MYPFPHQLGYGYNALPSVRYALDNPDDVTGGCDPASSIRCQRHPPTRRRNLGGAGRASFQTLELQPTGVPEV